MSAAESHEDALTSTTASDGSSALTVDLSGLQTHPVVTAVLAAADHRRKSCCEGDAMATCPWPDGCDECGKDWPCTVAQAAMNSIAVVLRWLAADIDRWSLGHDSYWHALRALADEIETAPKGDE